VFNVENISYLRQKLIVLTVGWIYDAVCNNKSTQGCIQNFVLQTEFNTKGSRKQFSFPLVLGSALISDHAGRGAGTVTERLVRQPHPLPLNFDIYYCIRASFGSGSGTLHN
jgi:hypothetical protein